MRKGHDVVVEPKIVSYVPTAKNFEINENSIVVVGENNVNEIFDHLEPISSEHFRALNASLRESHHFAAGEEASVCAKA